MQQQPRFAIATKAAIVRDGRVLVIYRTEAERAGDDTQEAADLPGGRLEYGEPLEAGLAREVYEKTGLSVRIGPILHAWGGVKQDGTHLVRLLYLCGYGSGEVRLGPEHQDYRWVSLAEAERLTSWVGRAIKLALAPGKAVPP